MVEEGRYRGTDFADMTCIYCDVNCIENVCRFLLECLLYEEIRPRHLILLNSDWHSRNHDKANLAGENGSFIFTVGAKSVPLYPFKRAFVIPHMVVK